MHDGSRRWNLEGRMGQCGCVIVCLCLGLGRMHCKLGHAQHLHLGSSRPACQCRCAAAYRMTQPQLVMPGLMRMSFESGKHHITLLSHSATSPAW